MLFTGRSIWTMIHGIVLGGGALMALFAALFTLRALRTEGASDGASERASRWLVWLTAAIAVMLWSTVLIGTYVTFPPYRATPPEGIADLGAYPKSLIQSSPDTAWLHSFAMETKEHMPWIAAMLSTAVALIAVRYRSLLLSDPQLNWIASALLAIAFGVVSFAAVLGTFVNKVAPLE
jgi:hypothetical protein